MSSDRPPIWIVNLRYSSRRRMHMINQMERWGLSYEIIDAVDGRSLTAEQLSRYDPDQAMAVSHRELSPGEIGCALTHIIMYQRLVEDDHDEVLILEDDVTLSDDFIAITERRHRFPPDWEMINFASTYKGVLVGEPIYKEYRAKRFLDDANTTACYLLKSAGAHRLLEHALPIRYPADGLTGRATGLTGLHLYGVTPVPVQTGGFHSDIWDYKWQQAELRHDTRYVSRLTLARRRAEAKARRLMQTTLGAAGLYRKK
ncbi:MAG: glycosyltransferase family 25 protein [Caldilineales bacterium]|nr:glycosyltransferase family 25 protein [Caldilineales bacterium]